MKKYLYSLAAWFAAAGMLQAGWNYEAENEFYASGDFDGDGDQDMVILDRETGAYRAGFQQPGGVFSWPGGWGSGVENVEGFSLGEMFVTGRTAMVVASPEANRINVLDLSSSSSPSVPYTLYPAGLGPNYALALDIEGSDNTGLDDLLAATRLNDGDAHASQLHTIRNGTNLVGLFTLQYTNLVFTQGNAVQLESGLPEYGAGLIPGASNTLQVFNLTNGWYLSRLSNNAIRANSRYVYGHFNASSNMGQFLVYQKDGSDLDMYQVGKVGPGSYELASPVNYSFLGLIQQVVMLDPTGRLMVVFGYQADIYDYDGINLSFVQTLNVGGDLQINGAIPYGATNFALLAGSSSGGPSTYVQPYAFNGSTYEPVAGGESLPPLGNESGRANVFVFATEPFVNSNPEKLAALSAPDWSTDLRFSGAPGNVIVTGEVDLGVFDGLGDPTQRSLGSAPAGSAHGLVNQYMEDISVFSFDPASGNLPGSVSITPVEGDYINSIQVVLSASPSDLPIYYRASLDSAWSTYTGPFYLFQDATIYFYATDTSGVTRTEIEDVEYTFSRTPDEQDTDGDGVPDYVEVGLGLDPAAGDDTDNDGLSDLDEILQGTDPSLADSDGDTWSDIQELQAGRDPLDTNSVPSSADEVVTNALLDLDEKLASFDLYITPRPYIAAFLGETFSATGLEHRVYSLGGSLVGSGRSEVRAGLPAGATNRVVWVEDVEIDGGPVIMTTPDHYGAVATGTNNLGREMVGIYVPTDPDPISISHTYSGMDVGVEASNWVAAADADYAALNRETVIDDLTYRDTLVTLLMECKIGELLTARGVVASNYITLLSFRSGEAGRAVPTVDDIDALERRTDSLDPAYDLGAMFQVFFDAAHSPADTNVSELVDLVHDIYHVSSASNNTAPGSYPLPIDVIRNFLKGGTVYGGYTTALSQTSSELGIAYSGATSLLASITSRAVTSFYAQVFFGSFTNGCTVVEDPTNFVYYSLFDANGEVFSLPESFDLVLYSGFEVTGLVREDDGGCGNMPIEVESITLNFVPIPSDSDTDGNLVPDDWELYNFGGLGNYHNYDSDNDGYSDLQEYFDGTDPLDITSFGSGIVDFTPPDIDLVGITNTDVTISWPWGGYTTNFVFTIRSTDNILEELWPVGNTANEGELHIDLFGDGGFDKQFYKMYIQLR